MSFFEELKRRNVIRVGIAYGVASWLLLQLADVLIELLELSPTAGKYIVLFLVIGFVPALIFAWAFEMTPEGIKREKDVDRSQSITPQTAHKLDRIIIGILVVALGYFIYESRFASDAKMGSEPFSESTVSPAVSEADQKRDPAPVGAVIPAAGSTANMNSIAVLPFANRSNDDDDLFFTDGIHDDLLTQLSKIKGLKVISRTSVMEYRDTTKKIPEIAGELGVTKILEGGIQRAGKRIRINAQLIDVAGDQHLWAETFDREMSIDNIFDIQSEITRQIVAAVKGELSAADVEALVDSPTDNVEAYEAALRAKALTLRADYLTENFVEAEPWAKRAVELDPDFAEAWAGLVEIHGQLNWMGYDRSPERRQQAETALQNAQRLKPDSAAVISAEADFYYRFDEDYDKALRYFEKAHEAAPGDSRIIVFKAIAERRAGYWDESIASFEQAMELDPSNSFIINQLIDTLKEMNNWERARYLADTYVLRFPTSRDLSALQAQSRIYTDGDLAAARELMDRMPVWEGSFYVFPILNLARYERDYDAMLVLLDSPIVSNFFQQVLGKGLVLVQQGKVHYFKGNIETARDSFESALKELYALELSSNTADSWRWQNIAFCLAHLGDFDQALEASRKALTLLSIEDDHLFGAGSEQTHTWVLAMAGQRDEALKRLRNNLNQPEGFNSWDLHFDPAWDFFRDDPRFVELATPRKLNETEK